MDFERNKRRFDRPDRSAERPERQESVYASKVRAGKRRTYFFDVRQTKGDDYFLTITESTKRFHGDGYERHKIFLYKEDFNRFIGELESVLAHIKTELMPDYDYDEFTKRNAEYEARKKELEEAGGADAEFEESEGDDEDLEALANKKSKIDDDMSW